MPPLTPAPAFLQSLALIRLDFIKIGVAAESLRLVLALITNFNKSSF